MFRQLFKKLYNLSLQYCAGHLFNWSVFSEQHNASIPFLKLLTTELTDTQWSLFMSAYYLQIYIHIASIEQKITKIKRLLAHHFKTLLHSLTEFCFGFSSKICCL